jgi:hypothetical protein
MVEQEPQAPARPLETFGPLLVIVQDFWMLKGKVGNVSDESTVCGQRGSAFL